MAYTTDKKSTGLELLTDLTITQADLHIIGDVSDSGRAKAITEDMLEDYIANSDNFIDELTNNANFQTNVNNFVTPGGSPLEIEQDGVSIETSVTKINFTNGATVTNPATGEVDVDFSAILSGGGSGTLIDTDTNQFTVTNSTGVNSLAYTINVPGGTLGTKNAIRVSLLNSAYAAASGSSLSVSISYGGQLVGSGSVSVGLGGKMDVSALIVAAGSTNSQKSIAKSISQNTTTGGQITAFTSDYATTVDSTIDQDITVEISGQFGVSTQQTIEGIVVEKITLESGLYNAVTSILTKPTISPATTVIPHGCSFTPTKVKVTLMISESGSNHYIWRSDGTYINGVETSINNTNIVALGTEISPNIAIIRLASDSTNVNITNIDSTNIEITIAGLLSTFPAGDIVALLEIMG